MEYCRSQTHNHSKRRRIEFSIMNCHYMRYPLIFFLDSAKRYGFSRIELFGGIPHFYLDDVDDKDITDLREALSSRGLSISCFTPAQAAYPLSISYSSEKLRLRTIQLLKKGIRTAYLLGAATMLVSPGNGYLTETHDKVWGICRDSLIELGEIAEHYGIILLLEPLTSMSSNVINTSIKAAQMIREVGSRHVKSMMDIGVMNYMGETVDEYFGNLGDNLVHIHFTDGPGAHLALGDGVFPIRAYANDIMKHDYRGLWSFEINDKRYLNNPEFATEQNIRWLQENELAFLLQ